jgi:hypothetical protein
VVKKPVGVVTAAVRSRRATALDITRDTLKPDESAATSRVFPVHEIDADASGVLVFARTPEAAEELRRQFRSRKTDRIYDRPRSRARCRKPTTRPITIRSRLDRPTRRGVTEQSVADARGGAGGRGQAERGRHPRAPRSKTRDGLTLVRMRAETDHPGQTACAPRPRRATRSPATWRTTRAAARTSRASRCTWRRSRSSTPCRGNDSSSGCRPPGASAAPSARTPRRHLPQSRASRRPPTPRLPRPGRAPTEHVRTRRGRGAAHALGQCQRVVRRAALRARKRPTCTRTGADPGRGATCCRARGPAERHVLDVACGQGVLSRTARGARRVGAWASTRRAGLDRAGTGERAPNGEGVEFRVGDAQRLQDRFVTPASVRLRLGGLHDGADEHRRSGRGVLRRRGRDAESRRALRGRDAPPRVPDAPADRRGAGSASEPKTRSSSGASTPIWASRPRARSR